MNKAQFLIAFQERALSWYINYSVMNQNATLDKKNLARNAEFRKPKSQSQCITKIKEIDKLVTKTMWEVDQIFNKLLSEVNFEIPDEQ